MRTAEELLREPEYRVENDARFEIERMRGGDGYDVMDEVRKGQWRSIANWGESGWDLGNWPYVVIYWRESVTTRQGPVADAQRISKAYEMTYYVEGDLTTYRYDTAEERSTATDGLALFHWNWSSEREPDVEAYETVEELPAEYRGPCTGERIKEAIAKREVEA